MSLRLNTIRLVPLALLAAILGLLAACAPNETPDQIRQKTAQATSTIKRDTTAMAEGVKEGLTEKKLVDLNKASKDDLATLPGITPPKAERIIAERPYASTHQLVTRRVLTEDEYSQIHDRISVVR
jgi:DNA uptake protein ComE-like DNA-binding protein